MIVVVMGVCGCGKSTLGSGLAERFGWAFAEGDDYHTAANKAKMGRGDGLTDTDRWPWLDALNDTIADFHTAGVSAVVACSALKQSYRDRLRQPRHDSSTHDSPGTQPATPTAGAPAELCFVFLDGDRDTISGRMAARKGHYMSATMLDGQLATLEPPGPDESDVIRVVLGHSTAAQLLDTVLDLLPGALPAQPTASAPSLDRGAVTGTLAQPPQ